MFVGTGSDVGKSVLNAAFCRIFMQDGHSPAPFKAQNMALNSFVTAEGLEIGRAQAVQAEACGIPCSVEMNPVLLKPSGDMVSQVVLNGKPAGNKTASEYFLDTNRNALFSEVMKSYNRLAQKYNPIVIEGAGSISEMNLWDKDITNMRVAEAADAATILVADIDRGGVFASVYGSIQLLPPSHRKLIKGVLINKFRGDERLFHEGRKMLEEISGVPVLGVVPWFRDIFIEQEDSVVLDHLKNQPQPGKINIAVVRLKHMANFTDFDALRHVSEVNLYYAENEETLAEADIIIIPGSKNTIADMDMLRQRGLEGVLMRLHQNGMPIYGICGGFQMMGKFIHDPDGVEGNIPKTKGLGILPVETVFKEEKKTEQCRFQFINDSSVTGSGYEIHMGVTNVDGSPLCRLENGETDGCFLNEKTWGTYIHGIFDNASVIQQILRQVKPDILINFSLKDLKEEGFNKLANLVRDVVDMEAIYSFLKE
ncbi:adenosylcobyric acid synthase (glutamine-hydrolysing) [Natronoflexus pectinivorans]|uniref:Cobyric acid synthase n=2 Tax=Natronoflexus pectinivorans TaxID=682526 RepID=A0A4R2GIM2_9BACT|nr:adenosylcobyric acid synthase (glutamine-hydrolysing) [Natronoflexus pectinivorans]